MRVASKGTRTFLKTQFRLTAQSIQHSTDGGKRGRAGTRRDVTRVRRLSQGFHDALAQTDHYGLLGLPRFTTDKGAVKEAYTRAVSLVEEPDSDGNLFQLLECARDTLLDDAKRIAYDTQLHHELEVRQNLWSELEASETAVELQEAELVGQLGVEASIVPGQQKVFLRTFGCQHNQSDGEYMLGLLSNYGCTLVDTLEECDVCVVNSCTVKTPSESRGLHLVNLAKAAKKQVVLAGCVPSADKSLPRKLPGVSMLHATQLDRVVEVVEEASRGRTITLLDKREAGLPSLALPKVRQDRLTEIITINAGCLGGCTYCKTKLARGTVVSYSIDEIVSRALQAVSEGVCHIELASEDMGAYGVDIGTDIVQLLSTLSDSIPPGVMIRTGMTNPPYIMDHIDGIIEVLQRPNVYSFMHIPVQSGSDAVLTAMKRDYTIAEFSTLVERLREALPEIYILTDIICGFPGETDEDWDATLKLVEKYKFHGIYSSRFFAREGTPAARMKQLPNSVTKRRYQQLSELASSYNRNAGLARRIERAWFTGTDEKYGQTVGRTKNFARVVVPRDDALLGRSALVQLGHAPSMKHAEGKVVESFS